MIGKLYINAMHLIYCIYIQLADGIGMNPILCLGICIHCCHYRWMIPQQYWKNIDQNYLIIHCCNQRFRLALESEKQLNIYTVYIYKQQPTLYGSTCLLWNQLNSVVAIHAALVM